MEPMPTPEKALEMYVPLVESGEQALPMVLYGAESGPIVLALAVDGHASGALESVLRMAVERFGAPTWIVFSGEAYGLDVERLSGVPEHERIKAHPDNYSLVTISGYSRDEAWHLTRRFERVSDFTLWGAKSLSDGLNFDGIIPDVMRRAVEGLL